VDAYKPINENINHDLNNTFTASYRFPKEGATIGLLAQVAAMKLNLQYSFRAGLFILPIVGQLLWNST